MHPLCVLLRSLGTSSRIARFIVPLVVSLAGSARAATYYIDFASGADTNVGTSPTAAWKHCPGDPTATGNVALASLAAGDTVCFKGGVTYVLTGVTGVALRWNGTAGAPITYDGNSNGQWGTGRALFSDAHGNSALTGFSAANAAAHLVFRNLEFVAIGGSAALPADPGSPVPAKFGGGIAFLGGATGTRIESCVFRQLGYAYNQKPMSAASISGIGVACASASGLTIANSDFSQLAVAIDFQKATSLANVNISNCRFGDAVLWSINAPASVTAPAVLGCTESDVPHFGRGTWTGYGESPRTTVRTVAAGGNVTFAAAALATPAATFQWRKNGTALTGATAATLTLNSVGQTDAAVYTVVASNTGGSRVSHEIALTVTESSVINEPSVVAVAPLITTQPVSQTAFAGGSVTFTAAASGTPAPTYQWIRNGVPLAGATQSTLSLSNLTTAHAGTYAMIASNSAGTATSAGAGLTILVSTNVAPVITTQPQGGTVANKSNVTFTVAATGSPAPAFQWKKDGTPIAGATSTSLVLQNVTKGHAGTYTVVASNVAGSATSQPAILVVETGPAKRGATIADDSDESAPTGATGSQLVNLSVRAATAADEGALIVGFVIDGNAGKPMLVRGVGPTLAGFGVRGAARDPRLWLYAGATLLGANDDWNTAANAGDVAIAAMHVGAFALPGTSADAALLATLEPGAYTTRVAAAAGDGNGAALLEVYDAEPAAPGRLSNVSVRTLLTARGEPAMVGFVVAGTEPARLLIRAVGPGLRSFGLENTLANPRLELYAGTSAIQSNDDWSGAGELSSAFAEAGAFALADPASRDAALIVRAAPGEHTVLVSSADGGDGVVLIELYALPDSAGAP